MFFFRKRPMSRWPSQAAFILAAVSLVVAFASFVLVGAEPTGRVIGAVGGLSGFFAFAKLEQRLTPERIINEC